MKVITKTIESKGDEKNKKHLVYFFGLGDRICDNATEQDRWENFEGIKIHLFDYHYMESSYPEHFHDAKFYLKQALITAIVTSIIAFTGYSIIASKMSTSVKVDVFMVFLISSAIIAIIAIKYYSKIEPIVKFATKGKDPIKAGTKLVVDLLEQDVKPDDIILMGNSLGGGIAAEVLKKFEEENIYFTLIHSNSYSSSTEAAKHLYGNCIAILAKWFNFNYKPKEIIIETKAPVLAVNKIDDQMIPTKVQSVNGLKNQVNNKGSTDSLKVLVTLNLNNNCCNTHNIPEFDMNIDTIDYLGSEKMDGINKDQPYIKLFHTFIDKAHEYLERKELNKDFDFNNFKQGNLYNEVQKDNVSLIDIDPPSNKLDCLSNESQVDNNLLI